MTSRRLRERRISRAMARAEKPAAPDPLGKLKEKAHDLDLVRKSVDDAASVSGGLWLSYLFALFYIGIAAGGVTHKDLLLENPVRLPFLNVELPLVAFFFLAPILFLISHAYTLTHFVLLAGKVGAYNRELEKQVRKPTGAPGSTSAQEDEKEAREVRSFLRRQLPSNIFVQFLAGPRDIRQGGLGLLLKAIAWVSLVIAPVLLLLLIQVQFLPYHLEWVTWVQRSALLADMVLLWALWPAVLRGDSDTRRRRTWMQLLRRVLLLHSMWPISLAVTALALIVARFPGEWVDRHVDKTRWIAPNALTAWFGAVDVVVNKPAPTSVHDLLFNGNVDGVTRRRKSLFSNTLVLPFFDGLEAAKIDDPKKLDSVKHTLSLRGRHLEGAIFVAADLRKADLEGAELDGAKLDGAQLSGAKLDKAHLQTGSLVGAQLQGVSLVEAQLQSARLNEAQLQGALLSYAQLQGASLAFARLKGAQLDKAELQGASLAYADLQGAQLDQAHLEGARLESVQLQGASLTAAKLQGAWLLGARLQGASLNYAQLQGAELALAELQGASLTAAKLQGASCVQVQLQGASLAYAELQGASLAYAKLQGANLEKSTLAGTYMRGVAVWRANFEETALTNVLVDGFNESAMSKEDFDKLTSYIGEKLESGEAHDLALKRIAALNPNMFGPEANVSEILKHGRADKATYQKALADEPAKLACSGDPSVPFILRGLIKPGLRAAPHILDAAPFVPGLAERILSRDCPVSASLTETDKANLIWLAIQAHAPETKQ